MRRQAEAGRLQMSPSIFLERRRKVNWTTWVAAVFGLALAAQAVEKRIDFSGTWDLDISKSEAAPAMGRSGSQRGSGGFSGGGGGFPGGRGQGGRRGGGFPSGGGRSGGAYPGGGNPGARGSAADLDLTLKIEQTKSELRLVRSILVNGEDRDVAQVYKLDGSESVNPGPRGRGETRTRV